MCNCEDRPCCGCGDDSYSVEPNEIDEMLWDDRPEDDEDEDRWEDDDYDDSMDGDHDSAMRDTGWGTDEDYGYYGGGEDY